MTFIETVEHRQGLKICCLEEIAFLKGFIDKDQLAKLAEKFPSDYGDYLRDLVEHGTRY